VPADDPDPERPQPLQVVDPGHRVQQRPQLHRRDGEVGRQPRLVAHHQRQGAGDAAAIGVDPIDGHVEPAVSEPRRDVALADVDLAEVNRFGADRHVGVDRAQRREVERLGAPSPTGAPRRLRHRGP